MAIHVTVSLEGYERYRFDVTIDGEDARRLSQHRVDLLDLLRNGPPPGSRAFIISYEDTMLSHRADWEVRVVILARGPLPDWMHRVDRKRRLSDVAGLLAS